MLQMFFIFAAFMLYKIPNRTRPQTLLMVCMIYWGMIELKDVFIYDDFTLLSPYIILPDILCVPLVSFYFLEFLCPGMMTWRRCFSYLSPFFAFILLYFIVLPFSPYKEYHDLRSVLQDGMRPEVIVRATYILYAFGYGVTMAFRIVSQTRRYQKMLDSSYSNTDKMDGRWIWEVIASFIAYLLLYVSIYVFASPSIVSDTFFYLFSLCIWAFLLFKIMNYEIPKMLQDYWRKEEDGKEKEEEEEKSGDGRYRRYSATKIEVKIGHAFEEDKVYLNPELTINDLAAACHTNRTYLSEYLNKECRCTFYDYVNRYRIEHAVIPLLEKEGAEMTLNEIAVRTGFGSISSLRRAFRKYTGRSIRDYVGLL